MIKSFFSNIIFLFVFAFMIQSCESKKQNANLETEVKKDTTDLNQGDYESEGLEESIEAAFVIPIPSDEIIDEFYTAIFEKNNEKVLEMLETTYPAGYEPKNKISPIQALIWAGDNVLMVKAFQEGGAKINDDKNPMILVAAEYKRPKTLAYLIEKGCLIEKSGKESGAFNKAGFYAFYEGAKMLLLKGANQEIGDIRGKLWVFHQAVHKSDYEVLDALKLSKDDLDYNDYNGETALIIAVKSNNLKMVKYLLKKGVDKNKLETFDGGDDIFYGKLPIEIAKENNFQEIVEVLK